MPQPPVTRVAARPDGHGKHRPTFEQATCEQIAKVARATAPARAPRTHGPRSAKEHDRISAGRHGPWMEVDC
jgi:hypothetical protein